VKAEIIATGTEILLGEIVDTNTSFLAGELARLGIDIHFTSSVGDNHDRFFTVLQHALQRSDVIITTGGLGPTQGDITRTVIADVFKEKIYIDDNLKQTLFGFFSKIGMEMPENNLKQATLIPSAKPLLNPLGTAPGWWVEKNRRIVVTLPGPPVELREMWYSQVAPRLQKLSGDVIISRILKTWGLSEGKVDELLTPFLSSANPTLAMYARQDGIVLRITAKSDEAGSAGEMISAMEAKIRELLGNHIWGTDEETIAGAVMQLLAEKGLTLAVCESITGGYLTSTLANNDKNPDSFRGGIVVNGNEAEIALGLDPALLSEGPNKKTAVAIASLARLKLDADIGIGLDGKNAPPHDTGTEDNIPTGEFYIAVDTGKTELNVVREFSWRPIQFARRATHQALFTLRDLLLAWK